MPDPEVSRNFTTRRFLDRRQDPPSYVDDELPTKTVKIFSRNKEGTIFAGTTSLINMGSIHFSGSHYDFGPGTFSLRIIRRSVYVGSAGPALVDLEWRLRHSREGTIDVIPFYLGTPASKRTPAARERVAQGGPMNPIYSFGPGTLWTYFKSRAGTVRVYSSLEGVVT